MPSTPRVNAAEVVTTGNVPTSIWTCPFGETISVSVVKSALSSLSHPLRVVVTLSTTEGGNPVVQSADSHVTETATDYVVQIPRFAYSAILAEGGRYHLNVWVRTSGGVDLMVAQAVFYLASTIEPYWADSVSPVSITIGDVPSFGGLVSAGDTFSEIIAGANPGTAFVTGGGEVAITLDVLSSGTDPVAEGDVISLIPTYTSAGAQTSVGSIVPLGYTVPAAIIPAITVSPEPTLSPVSSGETPDDVTYELGEVSTNNNEAVVLASVTYSRGGDSFDSGVEWTSGAVDSGEVVWAKFVFTALDCPDLTLYANTVALDSIIPGEPPSLAGDITAGESFVDILLRALRGTATTTDGDPVTITLDVLSSGSDPVAQGDVVSLLPTYTSPGAKTIAGAAVQFGVVAAAPTISVNPSPSLNPVYGGDAPAGITYDPGMASASNGSIVTLATVDYAQGGTDFDTATPLVTATEGEVVRARFTYVAAGCADKTVDVETTVLAAIAPTITIDSQPTLNPVREGDTPADVTYDSGLASASNGESVSLASVAYARGGTDFETATGWISAAATEGEVVRARFTYAATGCADVVVDIETTVLAAIVTTIPFAITVTPENTIRVDYTDSYALEVFTPTAQAGNSAVDDLNKQSGMTPVLLPRIVAPADPVAGAVLTAEHGLIMRDTADGVTTRTSHWYVNGAEASGETETTYTASEGSVVRQERYISDRGVLVMESPAIIVGAGAPQPLVWIKGSNGPSSSAVPTVYENGDVLINSTNGVPNPRAYVSMPTNTDLRFIGSIDRRSGRIFMRASNKEGLLGNTIIDSTGAGIVDLDFTFNSGVHIALHLIVIDGTPREALILANATLRAI